MIFIGLDVSKISTALCIEKNNTTKLYSYTTQKNNNTWVKQTSHIINYRNIEYTYDSDNYSESEINKLKEFDIITNLIINDIFENVKILDSIRIGIEGYSYSSTGPIFDLIEFTTILKHKLLNNMNKFTNILIISPLTIKNECCKMSYKPRIETKGKKIIKEIYHYENNEGKSSNKFDKWDMLQAFINSDIKSDMKDWCKEFEIDIKKNKKVPKPIDDIIDSIWIKEIIKKEYKN